MDYAAVRKVAGRGWNDILGEWERGGKQGLCPVPDEATTSRLEAQGQLGLFVCSGMGCCSGGICLRRGRRWRWWRSVAW